jgi:hypothetical protein
LPDGLDHMPGQLTVSTNGNYQFELSFAQSETLMSIDDWMQQPVLSPKISVREIIKSVADKERAHSDPDYNETLVKAKLVTFATIATPLV